MKYPVALALLFALPAVAQHPTRAPLPGTSELVVQVADSGAVAWERAARLLVARGYRLRVQDRTGLRLETEPRTLRSPLRNTVQVIVMGRYVRVSGQVVFPDALQYPVGPITFPNPRRDPEGILPLAWAELAAFAQALHGKVFYLQPSQLIFPH
jgi:hypothetical protein